MIPPVRLNASIEITAFSEEAAWGVLFMALRAVKPNGRGGVGEGREEAAKKISQQSGVRFTAAILRGIESGEGVTPTRLRALKKYYQECLGSVIVAEPDEGRYSERG